MWTPYESVNRWSRRLRKDLLVQQAIAESLSGAKWKISRSFSDDFFWDISDARACNTCKLGRGMWHWCDFWQTFPDFLTFSFCRRWDETAYSDCLVSPPDVSNVFSCIFHQSSGWFPTTCSDSMTSNRQMLKMPSSNELWWKVSPYRRTRYVTTQRHKLYAARFFFTNLFWGEMEKRKKQQQEPRKQTQNNKTANINTKNPKKQKKRVFCGFATNWYWCILTTYWWLVETYVFPTKKSHRTSGCEVSWGHPGWKLRGRKFLNKPKVGFLYRFYRFQLEKPYILER